MPVFTSSGNQVSLVTPKPMLRKTQRLEGAAGAVEAAEANRRNPIDSSAGSAIAHLSHEEDDDG